MEFKQFLSILRDLFMPQPRNSCQHCGGIRCIGACQFNNSQPQATEQKAAMGPQALQEQAPTAQANNLATGPVGSGANGQASTDAPDNNPHEPAR